jgi:hypothetical protein
MLKISLDEAYVFDLLAINEVKMANSTGDKRQSLIKSYSKLSDEIQTQIGKELFDQVVKSTQYLELKIANEKVFKLVDRSSEEELANVTNQANYERYTKKVDLQSKFFNEKLTEVKV